MRDKGIREVQTMCYESIELDMYSDREGRKASAEPGASLHSNGKRPTTGESGALASRPQLLQISEAGCRGPLFGARGR